MYSKLLLVSNLVVLFVVVLQFKCYSAESVMEDGITICAENKISNICIEAEGLIRHITWEQATRSVEMVPRKKRWYGKLGLVARPSNWKYHNGITRANVREAQLHFSSKKEFTKWSEKYFDPKRGVYRDDGLFISWYSSINKEKKLGVLDLSVWQIMINKVKPNKLPYSQKDKILVTHQGQ